ncbi:hypothetical protein CP968_00620 [Streptomyces subrutilus]|uniref:Uncharacterized protein n=1 Tax=Streptomyces subrutilus TaxID=36818 RepID=A0A5P2UKA5_9ACTN|nr:hypothetical protein CP968_00620 [Streptomyces subrutilus]
MVRGGGLGRLFRIVRVEPASSGAVHRRLGGTPEYWTYVVFRQGGEVRCRAARVRQDPEETP